MFGIFRKRHITKINNALFAFHHNLKWINHWIDYIRQDSFFTKKLIEDLKDGHSLTKKEVESLKKWIEHLNNFNKMITDYINEVNQRFEEYNSVLINLQEQINSLQNQQKLVDQSTKLVDQTKIEPKLEVQQETVAEPKKKLLKELSAELTKTEKRILLELCKSDQKLSYRDLALLIGKSPNTVKNQINSIKSKGFPIVGSIGITGKKYYVEDYMKNLIAK